MSDIKNESSESDSTTENHDDDDNARCYDAGSQMNELPSRSEKVAYRKKGPRGGFRHPLWNYESSKKLIELVKDHYDIILNATYYEKKQVWEEITRQMQDLTPGLNEVQIKVKWTNIRYNLMKYLELDDKGRVKRPAHMDLLLSFLKEKSLLGISTNSDFEDDDEIALSSSTCSKRGSNNVQDDDTQDNVYSLLCQEITEPKIQLKEYYSEFIPTKNKKQKVQKNNSTSEDSVADSSSNIELFLRDIAKQLKALNERDKEFKMFITKTLKRIEERETAREERECRREKAEHERGGR